MLRLEHSVIVVTGSARGIGAAIAERCAQEGASVIINYLINDKIASETLENIKKSGGSGISVKADVRKPNDASRLIRKTIEAFGRLDILVNNSHTPFEFVDFENVTWKMIAEQIDGTLRSSYNCIKYALPYLEQGDTSAILNISSITVNHPVPGFCHRNVAKAALEGLTRSLAIELIDSGIRVNALAVGWTHTDQTGGLPKEYLADMSVSIPMRRFATPNEIAKAAVFLISPMSSYITGTVLPIAGGLANP